MVQDKNYKQVKTKVQKAAFENLINMVKEFELAYNLSPELTEKQKKDLLKKISEIFSPLQLKY